MAIFDLIVLWDVVSLAIKYGTEMPQSLAVSVWHGMTLRGPINPCSSVCSVMRAATSLSLSFFLSLSLNDSLPEPSNQGVSQ